MPVEWSIDTEKGVARIAFRDRVGVEECISMVRNVASVTTVLGDCSLLLDARELTVVPGFELVLKVTQVAVEVADRKHPAHYALIGTPGTSAFGKCRQVIAILNSAGIRADLFGSEAEALAWCESINPRLRPHP